MKEELTNITEMLDSLHTDLRKLSDYIKEIKPKQKQKGAKTWLQRKLSGIKKTI